MRRSVLAGDILRAGAGIVRRPVRNGADPFDKITGRTQNLLHHRKEETLGEETCGPVRSEAEKIYEAAKAGKENPYGNIRQASKVPYGYLAKDGIIEYNGVIFVCDEETNSICLGLGTGKAKAASAFALHSGTVFTGPLGRHWRR